MQSCLDLGNPAIIKGHTFAFCQACVSPRSVGTLSGVFPLRAFRNCLRLRRGWGFLIGSGSTFKPSRTFVASLWQPACVFVCSQPSVWNRAPTSCSGGWRCSTWGRYALLLIHPQTRTDCLDGGLHTSVFQSSESPRVGKMVDSCKQAPHPPWIPLLWKEFNHFHLFTECFQKWDFSSLQVICWRSLIPEFKKKGGKRGFRETDRQSLLWLIETQNDNMFAWWVRADDPFGAKHCWILYLERGLTVG